MIDRIRAAWRTPVPTPVRFVAMVAAVTVVLLVSRTEWAGTMSLPVLMILGFLLGAGTIALVLVVWGALGRRGVSGH